MTDEKNIGLWSLPPESAPSSTNYLLHYEGKSQTLRFYAAGHEVLRFEENGDAYVRGEKVDSNQAVYQHVLEFLQSCKVLADEQRAKDLEAAYVKGFEDGQSSISQSGG